MNRLISLCLIVAIVLLGILPLTATAAATTVSVESRITGDRYAAVQQLGTFEVPAGAKAHLFRGSASIYDQTGKLGHAFSIQRIARPNNVSVFQRNWAGTQDTPGPLSTLTLPPGSYVLAIGGAPGSVAQITLVVEK